MKAIFWADGSTRPTNPGYGGYGIFGYLFKDAPRPKNTKHPVKTSHQFTDSGVFESNAGGPIEVTHILEYIRCSPNPKSTNNENELKAALHTLEIIHSRPEIMEATLITDSEYMVKGINESLDRWLANGFKRTDGRPVAYIDDWTAINLYKKALAERGTTLTVKWVKGHSGDYGNDTADLYSVIGSNAARVQFESGAQEIQTDILTTESTYAEYKKSYQKDFIYHFKDLFFSSDPSQEDTSYCFISSNKTDKEIGRRDNTTIFIANHGYVPEFINKVKAFYRSIPRAYVTTCSMKLSRLENRDVLRLADYVETAYMLIPLTRSNHRAYTLVDPTTTGQQVFIQENTLEFPFIATVSKVHELLSCPDLSEVPKIKSWDVTDKFVQDKKLILSNKDKFVDFTYLTQGQLVLTQKLLAGVGSDIPSYLALKKIEQEIERVQVILQGSPSNNLYTLYVRITTSNRQLYSLNVVNKYLAVAARPG